MAESFGQMLDSSLSHLLADCHVGTLSIIKVLCLMITIKLFEDEQTSKSHETYQAKHGVDSEDILGPLYCIMHRSVTFDLHFTLGIKPNDITFFRA